MADRGHGCLDGCSPGVDVEVVLEGGVGGTWFGSLRGGEGAYRLVHETKSDLVVVLILGGDLRPKAGELSVGRTALTDNGAVPARVVVDVDNAECSAGVQAALDLGIVGIPVVRVERAAEVVVEEKLPADWDAEGIHSAVSEEVVHLVDACLAGVDDTRCLAGAVDGAAEVETGDLLVLWLLK